MKRSVLILVALIVIPLIVGFAIGYNIRSPEPQSYVADSSSGVFMPALTTERQDKGSDDITASRRTALTRAIEKISPAVVGINVTEIREEPGIFSGDPYFRRFFQNDPFWNQFFGRKYEVQGLGSGHNLT